MKAATRKGVATGKKPVAKKKVTPKSVPQARKEQKLVKKAAKAILKAGAKLAEPIGKDAVRIGATPSTTSKKVSKVSEKRGPDKAEPPITAQPVAQSKPKMGRPTVYKPEYPALATKFCLLGADDKDLARMFEVDESTIHAWKHDHPDFSQSIKEGKDIADAEVASKLFHRARGYSHQAVKIVADAKTGQDHTVHYVEHYPPDTAACIFWMKNRQKAKWRDKIEQEVTGPEGGPVQHEVAVTDYSQLDAKLAKRAQAQVTR